MLILVDTLALILVAGVSCQWLATRLRIPALILLLLCGVMLGPVTEVIHPSDQLGDLLLPAVKLGVAFILFEGGLNLHLHELSGTLRAIRRLSIVGIPLAWIFGTLASHYIGGLDWGISSLFGAIIVVTGPTVILPLLRHAKLRHKPAALLKWEGIVNDPLGAVLAVFVFHWLIHGGATPGQLLVDISLLWLAGVSGAIGGYLCALGFRRGLVQEHLKGPVLIALMLTLFVITNHWLEDAGLLTVTVMGLVIGNMNLPSMNELRRFKEYVTLMLVSMLFIVLSADINLQAFSALNWNTLLLIGAILFLVRPASVLLATIGSGLTIQERLLSAWIAPRGIVAAAVAGVFAPELTALQIADAEKLVPLVFLLIVVTVTLHGLTMASWGKLLGLASSERHGILIIGGSQWNTELCRQLHQLGVPLRLVDNSWNRLRRARLAGIPVHYGQLLSSGSETALELTEMETLLALTDNDSYNALVCTALAADLGWQNVYQLADAGRTADEFQSGLRGNSAFADHCSYDELLRRHYLGWQFQKTRLTENYDLDKWRQDKRPDSIDLLCIKAGGEIEVATSRNPLKGGSGDTLLSYVPPTDARGNNSF